MSIIAGIAGAAVIAMVLWEGFALFVLTRRVSRRINLARWLSGLAWRGWKAAGRVFHIRGFRQTWLSFFGPAFILLMVGILIGGLILGFGLLFFAVSPGLKAGDGDGFFTLLYYSGSTFFTLGIGDITPRSPMARLLTVIESGTGFGFLALVISYLPPLNQSFVRRETTITLLDARAGSPPTAGEMLRRHGGEHGMEALRRLLAEWEIWAAELLEGHLAFPALAYFRSQHDSQSWLGGLSAVLDTCALVMAGVEGACARQAELTFAIARHALVDISLLFRIPPRRPHNRLPPEALAELRSRLALAGVRLREGEDVDRRLAELRDLYEPFVHALGNYFQMNVPPWHADEKKKDNWQVSAWSGWDTQAPPRTGRRADGEHFKGG
jgi:hypothetical protein